jgi:DNA-binding beta-propeller fold protein YncE
MYLILMSAAGLAAADWVYEGEWGRAGTGNGEFGWAKDISVAPNARVYVADRWNERIQYFTATGSFLGKWSVSDRLDSVAVGPSGCVYVLTFYDDSVMRYTPTGSLLSSWKYYGVTHALAVSPSENVYCTGSNHDVSYFTSNGSLLGSWGSEGSGNGEFFYPSSIDVAPNGNVYVLDYGNYRVQYFTADGSFLGKWSTRGEAVAVAPNADVFVSGWGLVRQFTATGSFIFSWELLIPYGTIGLAVSPSGNRVYVSDGNRVIYYRESEPAVAPASLGKVKALFK